MGDREPTLLVGDCADEQSGQHSVDAADLSVHNEGPAISREDQAQLVKPFSLPRSGRGTPRGWGLGLTLVWGCVEAHGGRLEIESEPSKGTTFKLTLPFDARPYADSG